MTADLTTTEANKALVRRAIAANHGGNANAAEIFAPNFVSHMGGQPPMNRETFEDTLAGFAEGFPGYTFEIEDQIADGDLVVNRVTWRGLHGGEFAGVPATGRPFELHGINMFKVGNGRVVEQWAELDMFGLLQQIGAIPRG